MVSRSELRAAVVDRLGQRALTREELVAALADESAFGSATALEHQVGELLQWSTSFGEVGGRVVYTPALVDGTAWTVRVDAGDAAEGFLRTHPSLTPLVWWLIEADVQLVGGDGRVLGALSTDGIALDGQDTDVVYGPAGWLNEYSGAWVAAHVKGATIRLERLAGPPPPTDRQTAALRAGFTATVDTREVVLFDGERAELTFAAGGSHFPGALLADRDAFVDGPIPFLPDLVAAAGLTERNHLVADAGFDWDTLHVWQQRRRHATLYGLDDKGIDGLSMLVGATELFETDGAVSLGATDEERDGAAMLLAAVLEQPDVADAYLAEVHERDVDLAALERFAVELDERVGHDGLPGLAWLLSRCAESRGELPRAIELLNEATTSTMRVFRPALVDAASVAADRGDAQAAWALLRRAGIDGGYADEDHEPIGGPDDAALLWREVAPFALHRPKATAGRNDPCPCGSGRKYKVCHSGRERHDLTDRAAWLWDKAARYVRRNDPSLLDELAADLLDDPFDRHKLRRSPFVLDVALHEHGMLAELIEERGWLLPDDEALVASQWVLTGRSVFEVTSIDPDGLTLYDIGTGDTVTLVNAHPSKTTRPGTILVGRPLPVGDTHRAFGGFIPIPRASVNPILDAITNSDPQQLIDALADTLRPPQIRNTSGEAIVVHQQRWTIEHPDQLNGALTGAGFTTADENSWSLTVDTTGMKQAVVATVRYEPGDRVLVAETNSDERAAHARTLIETALPDARLQEDRRRRPGDLRDDDDDDDDERESAPRGRMPLGGAENDPALRAELEQFLITKEREWIDESIPALGGRTPRDAVTDPIGREQVRQLLASFPEPPPGAVMNGFRASRIRALLDLEE